MTGNQMAEEILKSIPKIMEEVINTLIPESVQIWLSNNYKLIFLIIGQLIIIIGIAYVIYKDIFKNVK